MFVDLEAANSKIANVETEVKKLQNEKNHLNQGKLLPVLQNN